MELLDIGVMVALLLSISVAGLWKNTSPGNGSAVSNSRWSVWSVSLSVCSSFISSVSLLGFPAEIYYQGTMLQWYALTYLVAFPIAAYVFLPVIYNLKMNNLYEYLELRFSKSCRLAGLFVFCLQTMLYNSVALYAPSLAISSLTGINLIASISLTAFLSALYIGVGGTKAGIQTSALQMALILLSMALICIINLSSNNVVDVAKEAYSTHRIVFNDFRIDPRVRHSFWALFFGGSGNILSLFAANQLSIQRYMVMPSLKLAQKVVLLNIVCNMTILIFYGIIGLLITYHYRHCHPSLMSHNEIFPRFVIDTFAYIPGAIGVFSAAIYSAGISTLSSSFNALSTVIVTEISRVKASGADSSRHLSYLPFVLAILSSVLAFLFSYAQSLVLQIAFSVFGAAGGPVLGSFIVGMFIPWVRGRAATVGLIGSTVICMAIAFGSVFNGVHAVKLPLNSCSSPSNSTMDYSLNYGLVTPFDSGSILVEITRVSYQYYSIIGVVCNIILSIVCQKCLPETVLQSKVDRKLLSPLVRKLIVPIEQEQMIPM